MEGGGWWGQQQGIRCGGEGGHRKGVKRKEKRNEGRMWHG